LNTTWLRHAFWLVLPTTVVAWVVIDLVRSASISSSDALRLPAAYWLLLSVYCCWVALYFRQQPWLMVPYYSSTLIPPAFLALGSIAVKAVDALSLNSYRRLVIAMFVVGATAYGLPGQHMIWLVVAVALTCLAGATVLRLRPRWHSAPAFLFLLVAAVAAINYASADFGVQLWNGYAQTRMKTIYHPPAVNAASEIPRAERFNAAIRAAERLDRHLSGNSGRPYFFWYDGRDELGMFYRSMTSLLFAWSTSHVLGEDFHGFDHENRHTLAAFSDHGMRDLVILTTTPHVTPPDSRFTLEWTDREMVGGTEYFVHYLAFTPLRMSGKS
jgi:hypothetical protein